MKINFLDPKAICLLLVSTVTVMSNATIAPGLPELAKEFHGVPFADILTKMILPLPALFIVIFAPILGWTADRFSRRNQLIISTILFAVSGVIGAHLHTIELILASRAVLGIAVAGLMTANTALISDHYSGAQRSQFMGLQQTFANIGGIFFIISAGFLAGINPRLPFYIYGVAILITPLIFIWIREKATDKQKINLAQNNANGNWKLILFSYAILIFCHYWFFTLYLLNYLSLWLRLA